MKKLEKLSLNRLSKKELTLGEMNKVKGGTSCYCGCCYSGSGGSSTVANGAANCGIPANSTCGGGYYYIC